MGKRAGQLFPNRTTRPVLRIRTAFAPREDLRIFPLFIYRFVPTHPLIDGTKRADRNSDPTPELFMKRQFLTDRIIQRFFLYLHTRQKTDAYEEITAQFFLFSRFTRADPH